ncbi:hypothetical protein C3941_14225 [Kaistia algarum]|uniref:hypothetical protein n=1 Tax=Kaistia algarum TaxID=2083279 RepID=UPI000CE7C7A4|nr:hypothetical protein [Kaistia algarum]MCX5513625.1 hypothetical protein [Kaistia algarum]PPE79491.1 hypothetical protein C3941_14225 [Kaistia algarum]
MTSDTIVLVTSIPPRFGGDDEARQLSRVGLTIADAVQSFEANGFRVVSINREGEAAGIKGYPTVEIREVPPGGVYPNKYGPNFEPLFAYFGDAPGAIVNADIFMLRCDAASVILNQPGKVLLARRLDVSSSGSSVIGSYNRGIDGLFFSAGALAELAADPDVCAFQLGTPYWDVLIPVVASLHREVEFVPAPFLLHEIHPARWNKVEYQGLREKAVFAAIAHATRWRASRPRADAFLKGLEGYLGGPFQPASERSIKDAAVYMSLWLTKIETKPSDAVKVDLNDPVIARFVRQIFSHTAEALTIAKWLDAREDDSELPLFQKVRRFVKMMLKTRKTQRRAARVRALFPD